MKKSFTVFATLALGCITMWANIVTKIDGVCLHWQAPFFIAIMLQFYETESWIYYIFVNDEQ